MGFNQGHMKTQWKIKVKMDTYGIVRMHTVRMIPNVI